MFQVLDYTVFLFADILMNRIKGRNMNKGEDTKINNLNDLH